MIALILCPIYFGVTVLIAHEVIKWMVNVNPRAIKNIPFRVTMHALAVVMSLVLPLGFLLTPSPAKYKLLEIGSFYLGQEIYAGPILLSNELVQWIMKRKGAKNLQNYIRISGIICFAIIVAVSIYGGTAAASIHRTDYHIRLAKAKLGMKIVLISDLHLGFNIGSAMMEDMVSKINTMDSDIVVLAGDIFDNDYDALDDPEHLAELLGSMKSRYGTYACYGNHDVDEKILAGFTFNYSEKKQSDERMDAFLERANINLLRDETVKIDDRFYLCGRADYAKPGRDIDVRKTPEELLGGLQEDLPIVVIDHEPKELDELSAAGADLVLSGHTHDGQFFPLNIVGRLFMRNSYGVKQFGDMTDVVTSGVGLYGPCMRVGTISEICCLDVE